MVLLEEELFLNRLSFYFALGQVFYSVAALQTADELLCIEVVHAPDASRSAPQIGLAAVACHGNQASAIRPSICFSIFSTRARTSSRSLRNETISPRSTSSSSSRCSIWSRRRCASRSAAALPSRADFSSSMALYIFSSSAGKSSPVLVSVSGSSSRASFTDMSAHHLGGMKLQRSIAQCLVEREQLATGH